MSQLFWHQLDRKELVDTLNSSEESGLSIEAVNERLAEHGWNELAETKKLSPLTLFLNQFKDFMVLVLMGATLISGLLGEYLDAITILAILVINAVLGFIQEFRAERSLVALKELSAPTAKVIREGKQFTVATKELVIGDIVLLESGDRVPADIRFLEANNCYVEESALTGESIPVSKHESTLREAELPLGDQRNIGFMGTLVTRGTARGIVIRTGMATEMGNIANLIQATEEMQTPLQHRLEQLGKLLIGIAIALTIMVIVAGIMHGQPVYGMFLAGVSLAVAAIPEGLPAIVTVALALGVQRMIKRKAIVRKLPSVETLGCASVICSDKTGTLTQNKMTVTRMWLSDRTLKVTGDGYEPVGKVLENEQELDVRHDNSVKRLLQISALCNNARIEKQETVQRKGKAMVEQEEWVLNGDPTEGALTVLAAKLGSPVKLLETQYRRIQEFPFDSERKLMSVVSEHQGGRILHVKGAPDVLLDQCTHILWQGKVISMTPALKAKCQAANEKMAQSALRVLAFAYRDLTSSNRLADAADAERNLIFVGLTGMIDPPRAEVKDAIATCRAAGIKTVMITGDHQLTAEAIAGSLGIIPRGGETLSGKQLEQLSDEELDQRVENIYVYARVSPEHKLRIVRSLQRKGHVVAMTGDGVNDAPAIKAADIGIAMGINGTDVSKEASSLILSDDNFSTIVAAIEEGRGIYENIRKFIRYLLASNVGEILVMFFAMMAGLPLPLVPIQILWVNLVTDGLPAMALGVDQSENDLMQHKPRKAKENIFARRLGWKIISRGVLIGLCTLGAFWVTLLEGDLVRAQTVAFATLVMAQLIHVFDCRSSRSIFHRNILENKYLVLAVVSSLVLMLGVMYIEALQPIFNTVSIGLREWCLVIVAAAFPTLFFGVGSVLSGGKTKSNKKWSSTAKAA
ncbi:MULTISPECIES: calcium-translocating P-type ATPase, SERCA-type [Paenibacillus]|uniref:calcium-translocating P-type ATPase, SERCA-type n=1 Tax=Paenibacillus TaxID=44249 RepID=UPI0020419344|nr:calcium-translocating P-type ATPase, SERCA-type [Paenibacillus camelliae]MCM3632148.1 calcium-translocating P-type ATPase, SERCA-type [Paenibacillus camelliae]